MVDGVGDPYDGRQVSDRSHLMSTNSKNSKAADRKQPQAGWLRDDLCLYELCQIIVGCLKARESVRSDFGEKKARVPSPLNVQAQW